MSERLEAGWLDRVFNSTISLPQQFIWRIWRAIEDDEVDLFSEKGILDGALVPALGIFDDHKEDVMPDYMAEQMGMADKGESGFGTQLGAAILSDPLTYLTGGLSALGKVAKAATLAKRAPAMTSVLRNAAKARNTNLDDLMRQTSPEQFTAYIDEALTEVAKQTGKSAAKQEKLLNKVRHQMTQATGEAQARHARMALVEGGEKLGPHGPMTIADAVKHGRDRQISLGLPILHRWGAKWDIPKDQGSWWGLFREGVASGGTALATAKITQQLVGIPGVGTTLKNLTAPARNWSAGWKVGGEAHWGMKRGDNLTADEADAFGRWLSPDGAAPVALQYNKKVRQGAVGAQGPVPPSALAEKIKASYELAITKAGKTHEEAFKDAFTTNGIGFAEETGAQLYGRLTGRTKDNTFFPKWGAGPSKGKAAIEPMLERLSRSHAEASRLHQQGRTAITAKQTRVGQLEDAFETDRANLLPVFQQLADAFYATGKGAKIALNYVFRTGTKSELGEKAYAKFLADVARDNGNVEVMAKALYTKLRKMAGKEGFPLTQQEVSKLVGKLTEMDALPGEIAASFRAAEINPAESGRIMASMDNFLKRQRATLTTFEKLLKRGGIADEATRNKLVGVFDEEVFPFLEREAEQSTQLMGYFNRVIKNQKATVLEFTPDQQRLMRRVNNKHVVTGVTRPLTPAQVTASKIAGPDEFMALGAAQRAEPEAAMLEAQRAMGGGDLFKVVEDAGDLTHRLTENLETAGFGAVQEKVNRLLRYLDGKDFDAIVKRDAAANAAERGTSVDELLANSRTALDSYVAKHQALKPLLRNEAHEVANNIAIAVGKGDYGTAVEGLKKLKGQLDKGEEAWKKYALKNYSAKGPRNVTPGVLLGNFEGRHAGTLTNGELDDAIAELTRAGERNMTGAEIAKAAEEIPAIQDLIQQQKALGNDISVEEALGLLSRSGRVKTRLVPRSVTEPIPLWNAKRTFTPEQAHQAARQWGYDIIADGVNNTMRVVPRHPGLPTLEGFRSYHTAMGALRRTLAKNPELAQKYGPGVRTVRKDLRIASKDIERARKLMTPEDLALIGGKTKVFDEAVLPTAAQPHWSRLNKLKQRRNLPQGHKLREDVITPIQRRVTTEVAPPRGSDEFSVFLQKAGLQVEEGQIGEWALNYARGRLLMREVMNAVQRSTEAGLPVNIDPQILKDIESHVAATGGAIRNLVESHLPQEFSEVMQIARDLSGASFEAAKMSGVWMPGSPIAYLPRFFNKASRERIATIIGNVEQTDGSILARLGVSQAQYHKRLVDEMSIEDLNDYFFELREASREAGAAPELKKFHKQLDDVMVKSGIGVAGIKKRMPFLKSERLETDPFLALLQRFGVAQQDRNLQSYFDNMLAASNGKNGESLMLGGKIVGIVDDTGAVRRIGRKVYKAQSVKRGSKTETVALREAEEISDYVPRSFLLELDDGTIHTIQNNMMDETGYGLLSLGQAPTQLAEGVKMTTGKMFTKASLRSDLHNSMHRAPLNEAQAVDLLGKQVVFGHGHNITGLVKSAAQVHQVTAPFWRTFDAINYGIKSFQTIFRVPFHVANLSSGVFQASMAGATPKNLMASYVDTIRFMFGDQEFARNASMVTDLLDVNSETVSLGIVNLFKGERSALQQATQMHGDGMFAKWLAKQNPEKAAQLDAFENLTIKLRDGSEIDMAEFIQVAGEMQLYGTFASSLTRGSRSVADNLMRIKVNALDPNLAGKVAGVPKKVMEGLSNAAEASEVLNRTATALALVREGHTMRRAIEIAKEAHVPYEKLTPWEKNGIKRLSMYYTFPRHYMPWAWTRFGEDPAQLSRIAHYIRDQKVITSQEGQPTLAIGDYRVSLGRLNANLEAAGLLAAFADRIALPLGEAVVPGVDGFDSRKLRAQYSDAGFTALGGIAGEALGSDALFADPSRSPQGGNFFEEATNLVWPLKMLNILMGKRPSKEEKSPFVDYTPLESWLTNEVVGVGARKVRHKHELVRANLAYKRMLKQMQFRAAAAKDPETKKRYIQRARELSLGLRQLAGESRQKDFQ